MIKQPRKFKVNVKVWHTHFLVIEHATYHELTVEAESEIHARALVDCSIELMRRTGDVVGPGMHAKTISAWQI